MLNCADFASFFRMKNDRRNRVPAEVLVAGDLEESKPAYAHLHELRRGRKFCETKFSGDYSEEVPPEPIPNSEVKLLSADGTAALCRWKSRTLPD